MKSVVILAIETSCDETAAAVIVDGRQIRSNIIYSQIALHQTYGGVVPELASRNHLEKITEVVEEAMTAAGMTFEDLDAIAVTKGPGLVGALLVGVSYAKALAYALGKPLIGVHHIMGHICANFLEYPSLKPPFMTLIASGGHTTLALCTDYTSFQTVGRTRDDAIGEAFDKVARTLGLGYPGGPLIDQLAKEGDREAIPFPRTYLEKDSYDFSFSGIKSAVLNYINQMTMKGQAFKAADVAASFQEAIMDVVVEKTLRAARRYDQKTIVVAGGVAANTRLRGRLMAETDLQVLFPPIILCTDNAAMIGAAAYFKYVQGDFEDLTLNATAVLKLEV
jgi:N6-L-threonylcarbamoyladenine synthase